jgi:hypothetical protein
MQKRMIRAVQVLNRREDEYGIIATSTRSVGE